MENKTIPLYIDGAFVGSDHQFENINPINGQVLSLISEANQQQVAQAVQAARQAVDGPWSEYSASERAQILRRIADGIEARFEDFVAAEVADTGRPESLARQLDVPRAIANFRTFADIASAFVGESCETKLSDGFLLNYSVRKALGVIAVISPWNLPILLFSWKVAPALAAGNAVVCKPSEETPSSATLLAEVIDAAGLPKGVFNLLHGRGATTGAYLTEHPDIDAVSFTGGSKTGSTIMKTVADGVKEVSFELGGKNAAVVFEDADFDAAVDGVLKSSFYNSGQVCMCSERVYVHRSIFERFVAALKLKTEALRLDVPDAEGVDLGPMVSFAHREKVLGYFRLAVEEGATVVTGGQIPHFGDARDQGAFIQPTIWTGLSDDARCVTEEIFGPCCHIAPFDDEQEVLRRVNDSDYGLDCSVWTSNISRAHRFARKLHVGIVWVNTWYSRDLRTPFGGSKRSGLGREGGVFSLNAYSEISNICVKF